MSCLSSQKRLNNILGQLAPNVDSINANECKSFNETAGKVIKCKAAVAWGVWDQKNRNPLQIEQVEVAVPKDTEVRVKVLFTGVCHSDLHCLSGLTYGKFPIILGHEGIGVVESVGNKVSSVQPGDAVIPLWLPQCRNCKTCLSNQTNLCDAISLGHVMPDGTTRFKACSNGADLASFVGTATFSQYTVVPEYSVAKINEKVLTNNLGAEACLLACGITTGIGSARNTLAVKKGSIAAVFGLGGIGLSVVQGCRMNECSRIIAIDINPKKFAVAKKMGATECINPLDYPNKPIERVIMELTNGGVDYSFECVGIPSLMRSALECTHRGWGQSCIVGIAKDNAEIKTNPMHLVTGKSWRGGLFGGTKGRDDLPKIVDEYLNGKIDINSILTDVVPLSQINDGFWYMKTKKEGKIRTVVDLWK